MLACFELTNQPFCPDAMAVIPVPRVLHPMQHAHTDRRLYRESTYTD